MSEKEIKFTDLLDGMPLHIKYTKRGTAQIPLKIRKIVKSKNEDDAQIILYYPGSRVVILYPRDITAVEFWAECAALAETTKFATKDYLEFQLGLKGNPNNAEKRMELQKTMAEMEDFVKKAIERENVFWRSRGVE